ncbi:MAG: antifreeze protein [Pseudomonadota bacterium]
MLDFMNAQWRTAEMMLDAQTVVGLRMLGMAGVRPTDPDENLRMVTEKQTAFTQSGIATLGAMLAGKTPIQTYDLALAPIGRTTRENSRRLVEAR